jgi:hypothetical protein
MSLVRRFEIVDDHSSGKIGGDLISRINQCGGISPRFDIFDIARGCGGKVLGYFYERFSK